MNLGSGAVGVDGLVAGRADEDRVRVPLLPAIPTTYVQTRSMPVHLQFTEYRLRSLLFLA